MYIVDESKEKIKIEDTDVIENFEMFGRQYDEFAFAAFVISTILVFVFIYMFWSLRSLKTSMEEPSVSSLSDLSPSSLLSEPKSTAEYSYSSMSETPIISSMSRPSVSKSKKPASKSGKSSKGSSRSSGKSRR